MESNNKFNINMVFSLISFAFSIVSIFVMYYVFAGIGLVTALISIRDEHAKKMSITSIIIIVITFVLKLITTLIENGYIPEWLMNGLV